MAALAFRSAVDGGDTSLTTSSVAVSLPSGTASGDLMTVWAGAAVFAPSSAPTISTPAGWTLAGSQAVSIASGAINARLHLFYKVAGASEGSVTLDTGGTNAIFTYVRQSHRNPAASPFGQVSWGSGGPGTSAALGSLTTASDNALLSAFVAQGVAQAITPPASMTERVDNATYGIAAADEVFPEAGAAGTRTFALPSSSDYAWGIAEFASAVTPPDASGITYQYPHRFSRAGRAGRLALSQGQRNGDSIKAVAAAAFFGASGAGTVSADLDLRWSSIAAVQSDLDARWSLLNAAASDADLRWSLLNAAQSDLDARWATLAAVQADADLRWQMAGSVTSDLDARWALLNAAQADADLRWSLLGSAQADADLRWAVVAAAQADLDARWALLNTAQADADLRWGLLNAAQSDLDARWSILAGVQSDADLRWQVLAALSAVQADLDLRWSALAAAQADLEMQWQAAGSVTVDLDVRWALLNAAQAELDARWGLLTAAQADADLRWSALAAIEADADLRWSIGQVVVLARPHGTQHTNARPDAGSMNRPAALTGSRPATVMATRPRATSRARPH